LLISPALKIFFQTLKDILRVISTVENRVFARALLVRGEGGVVLLFRLIHIATHLNSTVISDNYLLNLRLGLLGSYCCLLEISPHKFTGNFLVVSERFVNPWVGYYLGESEACVSRLEHARNQVPESFAEERSTLEIRVLFPKSIKSPFYKEFPKVKKVTKHLKWRAPGKELKKNNTEREDVCRHSLKIVIIDFRGHVTLGAS